jgi:hypothetical protein
MTAHSNIYKAYYNIKDGKIFDMCGECTGSGWQTGCPCKICMGTGEIRVYPVQSMSGKIEDFRSYTMAVIAAYKSNGVPMFPINSI